MNRALPTIASGVDPSEEEERHLQQALLASVFGEEGGNAVDIPVPVVRKVTPPAIKGDFKRPDGYLLFDRGDTDLVDDAIEYDADYVDENFVATVKALDIDMLERAMDTLEKHQGRSDSPNLPSFNAMKQSLAEALPALSEHARKLVFSHWHERRAKKGKPFLRIFQPPPDPKSTDASVAFRPRERDPASGVARRMNTHENFKKASVLREELSRLRKLLDNVVEREKMKASILGVKMLSQRVKAIADGGVRMEAANRTIFSGESEPVIVYAATVNGGVAVPCRGLELPNGLEVQHRKMGGDKATKKSRRKPRPSERRKDSLIGQPGQDTRLLSGGLPPGVDTFGFDEHGNKFLKHMRYFAGGFMNYGVSPYDHRVFAAASERNTVRALPREPKAVTFPGPCVKFGRWAGRVRSGGKVGPRLVSTEDITKDILGEKRSLDAFRPSTLGQEPKIRRTIRARARVGRGGRIMLDRVVFERERGVKAASYPASVEMGGVYTGGIPLNVAGRMAEKVSVGGMGDVKLLDTVAVDECLKEREDRLVPALEAMVPGGEEGGDFWPRRRMGLSRRRRKTFLESLGLLPEKENAEPEEEDMIGGDMNVEAVLGDAKRRLPAFAPRNKALVTEV